MGTSNNSETKWFWMRKLKSENRVNVNLYEHRCVPRKSSFLILSPKADLVEVAR